MGYPNITNPSEKLSFSNVSFSELEYGCYCVSAVVNGELSMRDTDQNSKEKALEFFKTIAQRWAKYYPEYKEEV